MEYSDLYFVLSQSLSDTFVFSTNNGSQCQWSQRWINISAGREVVNMSWGIYGMPQKHRRRIWRSWVLVQPARHRFREQGMWRQLRLTVQWGWERQKRQQEARHVSVRYPGVCGGMASCSELERPKCEAGLWRILSPEGQQGHPVFCWAQEIWFFMRLTLGVHSV